MKILVSDYDGTFYTEERYIQKNVEAISRFRNLGNLFVIATGREYSSIIEELKKYHIPYDYIIGNHGSFLCNTEGNILMNSCFTDGEKESIRNAVKKYGDKIKGIACFNMVQRVDFTSSELSKVLLFINTFEDADMINHVNQQMGLQHSYFLGASNMVEISPNSADKSSTVSYLLSQLHIVKEDCHTIGNSENDINMIKEYHGCAVVSADENVKQIAFHIVDQVSDLVDLLIDNSI